MRRQRFATFAQAKDYYLKLSVEQRRVAHIQPDEGEYAVLFKTEDITPSRAKEVQISTDEELKTHKVKNASEPNADGTEPQREKARAPGRSSRWLVSSDPAPKLPTDNKPRELPTRLDARGKTLPNPVQPKGEPQSTPTGDASLTPCVGCGTAIPRERLLANPSAIRCVACQLQFERTADVRRKAVSPFAGTDEQVRSMKAKQWGEMMSRTKKR